MAVYGNHGIKEVNLSLYFKIMTLFSQLTVRKTRPPLVTVAMPTNNAALKLHTCSHAVKNTSQRKEKTDHTPTEKTEQVTSGIKQGLSF